MKDLKLELKLFHWHKDTRTLTAELSDLPNYVGNLPNYITIVNPDTNQSRVFRYLKTEKKEEEIQAWRYENLSHSLYLTIWND